MVSIRRVDNHDERLPLQRMRRVNLWALARQERIPITEQETKDQLLMKLQGAGIDPARPPRLELDPAITGENTEPPKMNYSAMNFFELRKACTAKGIEWAKTDKRTDLLAKLGA